MQYWLIYRKLLERNFRLNILFNEVDYFIKIMQLIHHEYQQWIYIQKENIMLRNRH